MVSSILPVSGPDNDPVWVNEPSRWRRSGGELTLTTDPGTDFWRHTHYGFVRDSGHFQGTRIGGEFVAGVEVQGDYREQYDQAGLMVRLDAERWVKTGIEFVDGRHDLSAVVTHAVSDWSVAPLAEAPDWVAIRLTRRGDALTVEFAVDGAPWAIHRIAYLPPELPAYVGPMAASPDGGGFDVRFRGWTLRPI
jgi:regulation of enolase protein 1 (concanavalin A-like superfamily)